ncbi:MAG TPA: hypothetical protein VN512_09485 [Clostridia bacterium]|nr:hypothetical protein [Clostridia bacterium]
MTEKKLKNILREHPYLIDGAFVRSRSEAVCLTSENGVTVEAFLERSKSRSSLPASSWDAFASALNRRRARDLRGKAAAKPNVFSSAAALPKSLRRLAAILLILALLTAFFTLTEPGAALAQSIYEIIVRWTDGQLTAQQRVQPGSRPPIDFEKIPERFESLEQAAEVIGRPVASIEYEGAETAGIQVYSLEGLEVTLRTQYQIHGNTLYLTQVFYDDAASWGAATSADSMEYEVEMYDGTILYIGYMEDGTVFGCAYSKNYNVDLASAGMDADELRDIAAELRFIEEE